MNWDLFRQLSDGDRLRLETGLVRRRFQRGEVIFHEGDPGESVHLIRSGLVGIRITSPQGDVVTVNVMGPGRSFGELALLRRTRLRTGTAVAIEATETATLSRDTFDEARRGRPSLDEFLLEMMADRVDALSQMLMEALYESVDRRCARRLLELAEALKDRGSPVVVPLTQEDLAELVGSTRPTVNQALRKFEERGWLSLARGKVEISRPSALQEWLDR